MSFSLPKEKYHRQWEFADVHPEMYGQKDQRVLIQ
jgi:hypothetical protein